MGWPHRQFKSLGNPDHVSSLARDFNHEVYEHMRAIERPDASLKAMLNRSLFLLTPVCQLLAAYKEFHFMPHEDIDQMVGERCQTVISSDIIENINNVRKNSRQARGSMKFRRPERSMAVALASEVTTEKYKYNLVEPAMPLARQDFEVDNAFGKRPTAESLDLSGICAGTSTTSRFSLQAENTGLPCADLVVLRHAFDSGDISVVEHAFMACCCKSSNQIIIRSAGAGVQQFD
jgi:hypothetical protein